MTAPAELWINGGCYALGFFDGVHIGHRRLLDECLSYARTHSLCPSVFTFPSENQGLKTGACRLYSTEQKLRILKSLGIERVVLADFESISRLSPKEFTELVLARDLGCKAALSGYNFRFGKGAIGDSEALVRLLGEIGLVGITVPEERTPAGKTVSATEIRAALSAGDIALANSMLGSPYFISGVVEHGLGKGHTFGFPTVNTAIENGHPLRRGVYKTELIIDRKRYTGLTNVGVCPTFGERELHAETMILDYSADLYGKRLDIYFLKMLREEAVFSSPEELRAQIMKDADMAKEKE